MINKKLLFATLIASSQVSANGFAGSIGAGAVVRYSNPQNPKSDLVFKTESASYFAVRPLIEAGVLLKQNYFLGIKLSSDIGNSKKTIENSKKTTVPLAFHNKSYFKFRIGPIFDYRFNDKMSCFFNLAFVTKHDDMKLKLLGQTSNSDKNYTFGIGFFAGFNYYFNKKTRLFLEVGSDYLLNRTYKFNRLGGLKIDDLAHLSVKNNFESSVALGLAYNFAS